MATRSIFQARGGHDELPPPRTARTAARAGLAAVLVVAAAGVVVAAVYLPGALGGKTRAPATRPAVPLAPPAHGAYFGAWAGPVIFTQKGYIDAVDSLQRQIGRRLDIVHVYLRWRAPFPRTSDLAFLSQGSMLLLSWAGTDTHAVESGSNDALIRQRARAIKAIGKPIFLEWLWEMDRPGLRGEVHSPADFVASWRHIRAIFEAEHVRNAAWVWCPTARGFYAGDAQSFYPGDSQVDWVCADAYPEVGLYRTFAGVVRPFLSWAGHRPKPILIGEFGVPQSYGSRRAQWLRDAKRTVQQDPQIKGLAYFDANPAGTGPQLHYSLADDAAAQQVLRGIADDTYFNPRNLPVYLDPRNMPAGRY